VAYEFGLTSTYGRGDDSNMQHVYWITKRGKFYGFVKSPETLRPGEIQDILEYEVEGNITNSFLRGGFQSHKITIRIDQQHIDEIKSIVRTVPGFTD
jgi:hypothetical protein